MAKEESTVVHEGEVLLNPNRIKLRKPIQLADSAQIGEVVLNEPNAGAMRGVNRLDLFQLNDDAHKKLLPRISSPSITAAMFDQMSLKDTQEIMNKVVSFFVDTEVDSPVT